MNTSWWLSKNDLDPTQLDFINLPPKGRYQLEGPAGSGKTNLLLLRAQFVAGKGDKNVLVVTYTRALCSFLRSGLVDTGLMESEQVRTFHSWASQHIKTYLNKDIVESGYEFDDATRSAAVQLLRQANAKAPTKKLISSVFIDEAQDLTAEEISCLAEIADNVCICGDIKQSIYHRNGLDAAESLSLVKFRLKNHYRIGHRIARVADRLIPPARMEDSLEATSNYDAKKMGTPNADLHHVKTREDQFNRMLDILAIQVSAYAGDKIGILCGKRDTATEVYDRLMETEFSDITCSHLVDGTGFSDKAQIHVMTMHSSKGVEFRAVHMFGLEELRPPHMDSHTLAYTAITRAKTALNGYCSMNTNPALEHAFAEEKHLEIDALFQSKVQ